MTDFSDIRTLDDLIKAGTKSDYALPLLAIKVKESDRIFLDYLAYDKYRSLILSKCQTIALTDEEWRKYAYRPDLVSMNIYGTPLLKHLVLFLNGGSAYKFNKKKLTLLPAVEIENLLQNIILHESDRIDKNTADVAL